MASPNPPQGTTDANNELFRLFLQTGDLSVYDYIQSGWTKPVSAAVQPRVQAIIRRYSNPAAVIPVISPGQSPIPGSPGAPPDQQPLASLPTGGAASPPVSSVWPEQPPGAGANNPGQGGAQAVPDPNALPVGGKGGGFFGTPPTAPPTNFSSVIDEFGHPAAQNYGNTVATNQAAIASQRASTAQAAGQRGGRAVSGFVPAPDSPLVTVPGGAKTGTPTGPFGTIDPTSAVAQQGYAQAQAGDSTALSAVLTQLLGKFGIDVNRGGIFTPGLVSSLAPYLKTVMEYGGLANGGKPVIPSQLADQFGSMIGGANTFGQIQDFARNLLPTAQSLLSAPAGALADTSNQVGMVNDLLGMLTAGANPIYQQYQQGIAKKGLSDYVQSQLGGPTANYIDWMRQNAGKIPGSDLLAQIIGASR